MNLRQIRTQLHLTQERMASELGISLRSYCRQEKAGGSKPINKLASLILRIDTANKLPQNQPQ